LPEEHLIQRISHFYGDTPEGAEYSQTPHRMQLRKDRTTSLYLHHWPEGLKKEWLDLLKHKTSILPKGVRRSMSWRVKPATSMPDKYSWGGTIGNMVCPAGDLNFHRAANILGFASATVVNGGLGLGEKGLTLASLADSNLIVNYLEYLKVRSGVHHEGGMSVLRLARSLVRPEYGYLWQYAEKYGAIYYEGSLNEQQWKAHCTESYHHLGEVSSHLLATGQVVQSRDPKQPIQPILDRPRPITALFELIDTMEAHAPSTKWKGRLAVYMRDLLLIKLLVANPLRAHHFCIMTYRKNNTGNLFQMPDGSWWLRYLPGDFKNQRGAAKSEYKVRVAPWAWSAIDDYLKNHRKYLAGAHTDYVFRPKINKKGEGSEMMLKPGELGARLQKWTHRYISGSPGFRAHAFRHIVATDFIKNHPQSFMIAAAILHDKIDTVMAHYAHLKKSDEFEAYNDYQEQVRTGVGGSAKA
jgi:integrase